MVIYKLWQKIVQVSTLFAFGTPKAKIIWKIHHFYFELQVLQEYLYIKTDISRRFHIAIQICKVLHHLSPPYLHGTVQYAVDVTGRAGRNLHRLFVPQVRTTLAKHSFYFRGSQLRNSLNILLYASRKIEQFKTLYKTFAM